MHHKVREILVSQRTQLLNALRSHLAEIGIIAAQGPRGAFGLIAAFMEGDYAIPHCMRDALAPVLCRLRLLGEEIVLSDHAIMKLAKAAKGTSNA